MDIHLQHRPDLQGLRAIAVLLVIFAHSGIPPFSGGFVGVDIFFVLSGYLISGLLLREREKTGRIAYLNFYARRLKRLLPALFIMVCVTALATRWLLSEGEARAVLASMPYAASWTSNLYFTFSAHGYFDELAARDLFLHTWSLGVEEQFYLFWPIFLAGMLGLISIRGADDALKNRRLGLLLALFVVASLGICIFWTRISANQAFYLTPFRLWQFGLGTLAYLIGAKRLGLSIEKTGYATIALWSGLALILFSALAFDRTLAYPGAWALLPSLGAALILIAGVSSGLARGYGLLADARLVWLGDRSYSLYLWHWPVLMLGLILGKTGAFSLLVQFLITLLLASLSYRLVEFPFWKGTFSRIPIRSIFLAAVLMIFSVILASSHLLRTPPAPPEIPEPDVSQLIRADVPEIYEMPCDAWYQHARVEPCVFESGKPLRTLVFLGDSIGAQWFSALKMIYPAPEWRILVLTKSACAIVDEEYFYPRIGQVYKVCTEWRNNALKEIASLKPDLVVMGSSAFSPLDKTQWIEGSERIFERLSPVAKNVFVISGTPALNFDGPSCILRNLDQNAELPPGACTEQNRLQEVSLVSGYLKEASQKFHNVQVLDLNSLVCPDGVCAAMSRDEIPVFRDSQHLTDSFVRSRVPAIRGILENQGRTSSSDR